ncbi:hypothetical protein VaNZ11_002008, partial [Volvox africanus]
GAGASAAQSLLGESSALLSAEEVGRLNRMEGFVASLGEHVRSDPAAKRVLSVLQPRLPPMDDKILRFLYKNRTYPGGASKEALAAKLVRDFKADELDAMRAEHLPWTPAPGGLKAGKAAELAEWIVEHQAEYLEQQGTAAPHRRRSVRDLGESGRESGRPPLLGNYVWRCELSCCLICCLKDKPKTIDVSDFEVCDAISMSGVLKREEMNECIPPCRTR